MKPAKRVLLALVTLLVLAPSARAQERVVRVASYNIKFLSTAVTTQGDRLARLRQVVSLLDADVIGLQEIDNRAALNLVFPPQQWLLVIDDNSADDQDVAVAVRKPLRVIGVAADLDADDQNFLFPGTASNPSFPNRRDLLFVEVGMPDQPETFFVMVHHAKSRVGGRATTDPRREAAARDIVQVLKERFDEENFILLGDFNDNPDDRSLNILETGDSDAPGGPEEIEGPFLLNLTEPLLVADHVSHGRTSANVVGGRVDTIDPGSRQRNNDARGTNLNTGDILFDQLLIPGWMRNRYVQGSAKVFDDTVAVRGNESTRASDHLPVFAEFVFGAAEPEEPVAPLRIASLLPNPAGEDAGREQVTLANAGTGPVNLAGWRLRDASGSQFNLSGIVQPGGRLTITLPANVMPLTNSGDEVSLLDPQGNVIHQVRYTAVEATAGEVIEFP